MFFQSSRLKFCADIFNDQVYILHNYAVKYLDMLSLYYCLQQVYKNLLTTHDLYGISVPIYRYKPFKYHRLNIVKNTKNGIQFSRKWYRN